MKIEFAPVSTVELKHVSLLGELQQKLNSFFYSKSYGEDLKEIYINVVIVSPRLRHFFKPSKPRYDFEYRNHVFNTLTFTTGRAMKYSISVDFEKFNMATESVAMDMLKKEFLNSISHFDRFKKKIRNFNLPSFRSDVNQFFEVLSV